MGAWSENAMEVGQGRKWSRMFASCINPNGLVAGTTIVAQSGKVWLLLFLVLVFGFGFWFWFWFEPL